MVIWITGLAGSGKTTVSKVLLKKLKAKLPSLVHLDGDDLREVFGALHEFQAGDRLKLAQTYAKLCKLLGDQEIPVICSTVSMFNEVRDWNRKNLKNYFEIYLKVPMDVLVQRDKNQLYSGALQGTTPNVMGVNLPFDEPKNPDLVINNDGSQTPDEIADFILKKLGKGYT